ncbi:MAG: hypothetical protein QW482_03395 [Thermoproteota archaeon]
MKDIIHRSPFAVNRNSPIIAFMGTVGSGKSTQMKLLALSLKRGGIRVKVSSLKSGYLSCILINLLAKILVGGRKDIYPIRALIEEKPNVFKKLFKLWIFLDMISISVQFLESIYVPKKTRSLILVEEYLPATIVDYVYFAKTLNIPSAPFFAIRFILKLIKLGGHMHTIFLDAQDTVLSKRWVQRASPNETFNYIMMQRSLLLPIVNKLSSSFSFIDTSSQDVETTFRQISQIFTEEYNLPRAGKLIF